MNLNTAQDVFTIAGIIVFAGIYVILGLMLYIAKTKVGIILSSLKNSSFTIKLVRLWNGGPLGRIRMVGEVCALLWKPKHLIQQGLLSQQDIENFPPALKRQLLLLHKFMISFFVLMICLGLIVKLELV